MKRLRHPIRAIREPFGTAGLVVACVALIAALGGTALAAKGALTGKQKKEVEKIAKKYAGKPGAPGAAGPTGPQGPAGAKGDTGAKGDKGDPGNAGSAGKSVTVTEVSCGGLGGAEVKQEGAASGVEVCNGEEGEEGEPGEPWAVGGTLPPEATETGTWSFNATEADGNNIVASIGFPVKLAERLEGPETVHFQPKESEEAAFAEFKAVCPNSVVNPTAKPGNLCVYFNQNEVHSLFNATFTEIDVPYLFEVPGASVAGALLRFSYTGGAEETAHGFGSWAVTAPAG